MTVRFRLTAGYFVISLLVVLVGATAIFELLESSRPAAVAEARNVAESIGGTITFLDDESGSELFDNPEQLKRFAAALSRSYGRDIVVTNRNKRIMADAIPAEVGTVYDGDPGGEVALTMADGLPRTFVEPIGDYPQPIQQLVVPLRSSDKEVIGAIIIEYGPFYAEMNSRVYPVIFVELAALALSLLVAVAFGYVITRSVTRPLGALRRGVLELTGGNLETQVCVEGKGEIADLAGRFNEMASARRSAEKALREARDTLEQRVKERTADLAGANGALHDAQAHAERGLAQLHAVVSGMNDGLVIADTDGNVLEWNPAALRMHGCDSLEEVRKHLSEFASVFALSLPGGAPLPIQDWPLAKLLRGEPVHDYELDVRRLETGRTTVINYDGARVPGAAGASDLLFLILHDVTERRQAEGAQRVSEAQYRLLFERNLAGVVVTRIDGAILEANEAAARIFGIGSREELLRKRMPEFYFDPADRAALAETVVRDQSVTTRELRFRRADGRTVWVLANVNVLYDTPDGAVFQSTLFDITERKRAETRLAAQHAVVSILAEASSMREAAPRILQAVCEIKGWDVGDIWQLDERGEVASCLDVWQREDVDAADFVDLSRRITFGRGEGLPGRVWASGRPCWIVDVANEANFARAAAAGKAGLRGAFGFPIQCGNELLGVVEFFSRESRQPDETSMQLFGSLGSQIGQFAVRKRAEESLATERILLRAVADGTTDAMFVKDRQGRYLLFNEAAARFVGKPAAEVLGHDDTGLFDPESARTAMERDRLVMESGQAKTEEERLTAAGVTRTYLATKAPYRDARGEVVGVIGVSRDITDHKRAEESLAAERTLLRTLIDSMPEVVFTKDMEGRFTLSNPASVQLVGCTSEGELVGKTVFDFFPRELADAYQSDDAQALGGQSIIDREEPCVDAAGNRRWYLTIKTPLRDQSGAIVGLVGISRDITERRQLEQQFRQAQKMEAFGQLAGGVAHDFNNVLQVITGFGDLLLETLRPADPAREMVGQMVKAGERAAGLTRQLLAFSRQQVLVPRVLELNAVVADLEKMLRRVIGEDIDLKTALQPGLGRVKADPGQIDQVVMNLAVNARDAMPQGGRLTIETQNVELDGEYARLHVGVRTGHYVLLAVSDTGCGMTPEVQARIFEPFFTTKEIGKGTGLGLSTVFGIVRQAGGHVAVYSEPGIGTSFKVYLPRVDDAALSVAPKSDRPPSSKGAETVLLVEDEESVRTLTRIILLGKGYTVLEASDGAEALSVAGRHEGPIHLLLSDVVMPILGGRELAERLVGLHPEMKVLFQSGYTDDAVVRHGVLQEKVHFLQKPYSPAALATKVREVLDGLR
jgi:PAS domain S-box-containing protein